jgi:hypothetical protein
MTTRYRNLTNDELIRLLRSKEMLDQVALRQAWEELLQRAERELPSTEPRA